MDGENNGKPYEQMDDLGGFTTPIFGNTHSFFFQVTLVESPRDFFVVVVAIIASTWTL